MPINAKTLTLLCLLYGTCRADTPSREPRDFLVCSTRRTYCAYVSINSGISVFQVQEMSSYPTVHIDGWYPQAFLSNDGKKLVTVGTTIVPDFYFDQPVVKVWSKGKLTKSLLVRDLLDGRKMGNTTSGFHWGEPVGFTPDESFFAFKLDDGTSKNIPLSL